MRMLLDRGLDSLPSRSLPQATRYDTMPGGFNIIGRHRDLDEMIFQELETRRELWMLVERIFRWAERRARERKDVKGLKIVQQYSWRVRYSEVLSVLSSAVIQ